MLFKRKPKKDDLSYEMTWYTPEGYTWKLCDDILKQTHVVIGGTTGSGKSTLLHSLMYSALIDSPAMAKFVIIDLKGTEMLDYRGLPHTLMYADEPETAVSAIEKVKDIMRNRLNTMKAKGEKYYDGADLYLVIDEIAVLMQTAKAKVLAPLADIMRLGRASKIHVIGATQNPSRSHGGGLPSEIIANATASLALRCRSSIESRQLVGVGGAENLPEHGRGLYWSPRGTVEVEIPMTPERDLNERINYWRNAKPIIGRGA